MLGIVFWTIVILFFVAAVNVKETFCWLGLHTWKTLEEKPCYRKKICVECNKTKEEELHDWIAAARTWARRTAT